MSGITSVTSGYGSTLSLTDILSEGSAEGSLATSGQVDASVTSKLALARKMQSYSGQNAVSSQGQAALKRALGELSGKIDGRVTFKSIAAYREELEASFTAKVRKDLTALGVDPATEFTLNLSAEGAVQVVTDDAKAKQAIQQYLKDTPKVCEEFGYIQALANLERARQSPASAHWQSMKDATASFQASAVEAFFSDALNSGMNYTSLLASFTGADVGAASFYAGIDYTV